MLEKLKVKGKFDKSDKTIQWGYKPTPEKKQTPDDIETMLDDSLEDHEDQPVRGGITGSPIRERLLGGLSKPSSLLVPDYIPLPRNISESDDSQLFENHGFDNTGYDFLFTPPRTHVGPSSGLDDNDDEIIVVDDEDTLKLGDPVPPTPTKRLFRRGADCFPSGTTQDSQDSLRRMNAREFEFD